MTKITQDTTVSVGLVIVLVGGVMWLANVNSKAAEAVRNAEAARVEVKDLKVNQTVENAEMKKLLIEILQRVTRVEERTRRRQ